MSNLVKFPISDRLATQLTVSPSALYRLVNGKLPTREVAQRTNVSQRTVQKLRQFTRTAKTLGYTPAGY